MKLRIKDAKLGISNVKLDKKKLKMKVKLEANEICENRQII